MAAKNKKLMRSKLLLENTTRARKVNQTKEHSASIDGYKHSSHDEETSKDSSQLVLALFSLKANWLHISS